jgi:ATP-binding cassette subfamily B protein/subfamily B ATP-binding cassette protein MsbA
LVGGVVNLSLFDMRNRFFRRSITYDVSNFSGSGTHELMSRFTNDMDTLGNGLKMLFGRVIAEPLRAVGCVVFACFISWQLTLMFMVLIPIALYILTRVGRLMKKATRRVLEHMSNIYKILQESFQGIRIVKAFGRESWERRRFRQATREHYRKSMRVINLDALAGPVIEVMGVAAVTSALLAGAYLVLNRETHLFGLRMMQYPMSAESLIQLYVLLAAIADPVRKLSSVFTKIQSGAAASDRIFQFMDREPKIRGNVSGPSIPRDFTEIVFKDICFSYDPGHPVLNGIDLTVRQGETIAVVGKNGCGKSTLLALLPRFYDPDHGSILIDGIDVRVANLRSLRRQVALVTQDTVLFDDTLYNNIAYGKRRATREEVERAAVLAQAHDFITRLPNGYDTRAGEAGAKLSGGQKQRLSLARAILRDPSILILDEFTSAADAESELEVHRLLRDFMKGRTTFIITHRLNTLEIADRIMVLDQGRVVAIGKHAELMQTCPLYQRLQEATTQRFAA